MAAPKSALVIVLLMHFASSLSEAQSVGTAYSGPATGDGSAPYYNPAAMALGDSRIDLDLGVSFVSLSFDPDGLAPVSASPLRPYLTLGAFTDALHPSLRLGVTIGIPATAGGAWDTEAEAAAVTRYYLKDATVIHTAATPGLSYSPLPWLSFGASAQLVYATSTTALDKDFGSQLNMSAMSDTVNSPFPYADAALAAPIDLSASGFGVGGIFGVVVRPSPIFTLGLSVHTPVHIDATGDIAVTYPESLRNAVADILPSASLPELSGSYGATMDLPWAVHVGAVVRPLPTLELSLYYRWENVSSQPFWNVDIIEATSDAISDTTKIQGYVDRHFIQFRAGVDVLPTLDLSVFGSYQRNTVPELTTSPNTLDFDRIDVGLAARWRVAEHIGLLFQYSHLFLVTRVVDESLHRPLADPALANFNHPSPAGTYSGSANTIRLSLQVLFDRGSPSVEGDATPETLSDPPDEELADESGADENGADEELDSNEAAGDEPSDGEGEPWWQGGAASGEPS